MRRGATGTLALVLACVGACSEPTAFEDKSLAGLLRCDGSKEPPEAGLELDFEGLDSGSPKLLEARNDIEPGGALSEGTAPRIILLISLDTLRADHLGVYGYERFTSPVLDRLAEEGVVFEDASSTAPWTLPSHASILTGLTPLNHRVLTPSSRLPGRLPTLAGLLARAGYETAAVVNSAWLHKRSYQLTRDFERFLAVGEVLDRREPSTWVTDQALEWLGELGDRHLFLFAHYFDLHSDYVSLPAYERQFLTPYEGDVDGSSWQLRRANLPVEYVEMCRTNFDPTACRFASSGPEDYVIDESFEPLEFDGDDVRRLEELYDAGVRQLDTELSRLFVYLRTHELMDKTLIVVTSDHGEEFMDHGRFEHFLTTHQEVLRVPLLMRGPGIPKNLRISAPVSSIDIAPTLLALAGVETPKPMDGLDLAPLWRGGDPLPFEDRYLYGESSGGLVYDAIASGFFPVYRSVRQGRYKLVYESKGGTHALFDLEEDPREEIDISTREPDLTAHLSAALRDRYLDFTPEPSPEDRVELEDKDLEKLRALGYVP